MERIPVSGPWITRREIDYVTDAVTNAWYGNANVYHARFEAAFAEYVGRRFAVALPSCTSAIHLALLALGVGPGDEVVVPEATWIATAAPVRYVGATPVFADVDPDSWCISAGSFAECVTPRTRAVIPVDLYGGVPDWDAVREVAARHGIAVVEDAAQAVGSEYHGARAGSFGEASVFSFHGSKTLTTGEGGMLLTDGEELYRRALFLRDHGRHPGDTTFFNTEVAYKYRMSSMQAALGLAQLERVEELVARKREVFSWYAASLADEGGLTLNSEPEGTKNSYWMVTALWDSALGLEKESVVARMRELGADCRPFFHPLSGLPAFAGTEEAERARGRNRVSYDLGARGINLPSAPGITREQVETVCAALREALSGAPVRPGGR